MMAMNYLEYGIFVNTDSVVGYYTRL